MSAFYTDYESMSNRCPYFGTQYAALWVESAVLPSGTTGNNNFSGGDKVLHFLILHKQTADNVDFLPP